MLLRRLTTVDNVDGSDSDIDLHYQLWLDVAATFL